MGFPPAGRVKSCTRLSKSLPKVRGRSCTEQRAGFSNMKRAGPPAARRAATPISQIYVGMTSPQRRIDRGSPGAKETRARGQGNAGRGGRHDVFSIVRLCPFQSARVLPKIWKINRRRIPGVWHHLVGCVSPHPARRLIIFSPRCVVRHVILFLSILPLGLLIPAWLTPYAP